MSTIGTISTIAAAPDPFDLHGRTDRTPPTIAGGKPTATEPDRRGHPHLRPISKVKLRAHLRARGEPTCESFRANLLRAARDLGSGWRMTPAERAVVVPELRAMLDAGKLPGPLLQAARQFLRAMAAADLQDLGDLRNPPPGRRRQRPRPSDPVR